MTKPDPFRYFKTSREIIRFAVMLYVRFPLSLRNVEDLLHERGIDVSHETIRFWWNRFGPMFASGIRNRRVHRLRAYSNWQWYLDEVFVKINGVRHYLWRAVDHEGEVLEAVVTKRRNKAAALKFLKKLMKRHGKAETVVTDRFASYRAALRELGAFKKQQTGRWLNNRVENSHLPFRRRERAMLRFRQMRCLQKSVAVYSSLHNRFNHKRHAKQHFHREARLYGGVAIALLATSPACRHGIPAHLRVEPTSRDIAPQYPAGQWIVSAPRCLSA